jgi:hypothetical protein
LALGLDLRSVSAFEGIADADIDADADCSTLPCVDPPDPWIAAGPSHLLQSTNLMLRITDRRGTELQSIPTRVLFGLDPTEAHSDPRFLWDAYHARWLGIELGYSGACDEGFLSLVVSETANPLGAWDLFRFPYTDQGSNPVAPDYPAIASTTDKVVITSNDFALVGSGGGCFGDFVNSSARVIDWSTLLAATPSSSAASDHWFMLGLFTPRPGIMPTPVADAHLVLQANFSDATNSLYYVKLTGTVAGTTAFSGTTDLTASAPWGVQIAPPPPQQVGADEVTTRIDARPTDAVWRNGHLWLVATEACSWDGGSTIRACIRLMDVQTSPSASVAQDMLVGEDGFDAYFGGVGISTNGTTFATWAQSSDSSFIDTWAAYRDASDAPSTLSTPIRIATGSGAYIGDRWGDFSGVAFDPAGSGAVWTAPQYPAADGDWATRVSRLVVDGNTPTTTAPTQAFVVPSTLGSTVPIRLSWSGSDPTSGIARYQVNQNLDSTGFATLTSTLTTASLVRGVYPSGHTYRYRVRAWDGYGNLGSYATGPTFTPTLYQQTSGTVTYSGTWRSSSSSGYSGGSVRYASTAGRKATFKCTNARNIGFVTTKASSRGRFKVYVDGVYKKTVNAHASTTRTRQLLVQFGWSSPGTHTMAIVVSGTAGHPRVDIDAFVCLR